jgi:hypothetical protein
MTLKQAIEKAQEYGFVMNGSRYSSSHLNIQIVLLDPSFWQCLGKAMGWGEGRMAISEYDGVSKNPIYVQRDKFPVWIINWHRLIDHLSEGGTIEKYFESLTP